jgi:hypothetical protein
MREYACIWSWFRRINGSKSTRSDSTPSSSSFARKPSLTLSQQKGLHFTTSRELGILHSILAHTRSTRGVICTIYFHSVSFSFDRKRSHENEDLTQEEQRSGALSLYISAQRVMLRSIMGVILSTIRALLVLQVLLLITVVRRFSL